MARTSPPNGAAPGPTRSRLSGFAIRADQPDTPAARMLIARHLAAMTEQSPPDSVHALDAGGLNDPDIRFFILWEGDTPLAMGALKRLSDREGELKSMHVAAEARGRGVGAAILNHLLGQAAEMGLTRVSLETGSSGDFAPARRLYARHGFVPCPPFADYAADPHSSFMTRKLDQVSLEPARQSPQKSGQAVP